jgi:quinol monooxygenase YgiN
MRYMHENEVEKMMIATTRVTVLPESRKEFFQTISPLTERIRKEKGCLNYRLYEEAGHENSLVVIEEWAGESQWEEHRNGHNFAVLYGLLSVLSIPSKIDFKLLTQVSEPERLKGS